VRFQTRAARGFILIVIRTTDVPVVR